MFIYKLFTCSAMKAKVSKYKQADETDAQDKDKHKQQQ